MRESACSVCCIAIAQSITHRLYICKWVVIQIFHALLVGTMEFQWAPPVDLLIKQGQLVFSGIVIRHMASAALSPHSPTGQQGVMQSSIGPKLWSFCQLLLAAEQAPNGILSSQVEIALATSPSLIPQLWYAYFKVNTPPALSSFRCLQARTRLYFAGLWCRGCGVDSDRLLSASLITIPATALLPQKCHIPFSAQGQGKSGFQCHLITT